MCWYLDPLVRHTLIKEFDQYTKLSLLSYKYCTVHDMELGWPKGFICNDFFKTVIIFASTPSSETQGDPDRHSGFWLDRKTQKFSGTNQ